jgi:hypothetical protein
MSVCSGDRRPQAIRIPQPHAVFLIPELMIQVFNHLDAHSLRTCFHVSHYWTSVLRAHLPPEKLPLPHDWISTQPKDTAWFDDNGVWLHPALEHFCESSWWKQLRYERK